MEEAAVHRMATSITKMILGLASSASVLVYPAIGMADEQKTQRGTITRKATPISVSNRKQTLSGNETRAVFLFV